MGVTITATRLAATDTPGGGPLTGGGAVPGRLTGGGAVPGPLTGEGAVLGALTAGAAATGHAGSLDGLVLVGEDFAFVAGDGLGTGSAIAVTAVLDDCDSTVS